MPIVLFVVYKRIVRVPPTGSVVRDAFRVFNATLTDGGWKHCLKGGESFWQKAKPSYIAETGTLSKKKEGWVCWDVSLLLF